MNLPAERLKMAQEAFANAASEALDDCTDDDRGTCWMMSNADYERLKTLRQSWRDAGEAFLRSLGEQLVPSYSVAYREFLTDVITGFCEGRPYSWFDVAGYRWFDPDLDGGTADPGPNGVRNAYAKSLRGQNPKNDNSWLTFKLDVDLVHKGCERLKTPIEGLSDRYRGEILGAITANDCGQLDINSYDVIMQAACFDQIVYS